MAPSHLHASQEASLTENDVSLLYNPLDKHFEIQKANAVILKGIVNARKINFKETMNYITEIKRQESRSQIKRQALFRQDLYKQMDINKSNQRLAIRLFGQKPTYQVLKFENDHNKSKKRLKSMSRFVRNPFHN